MHAKFRIAPLLALLLAPAACATIIHGTSQDIAIHSTPENAAVVVDSAPIGHTPLVYKMSRNREHTVTLTLDGYQPETIHLTRSVSGWFFGNILIGGLVGIAVDAVTGGMYNLKPGELQSALAKDGAVSQLRSDGLYVVVVMRADPGWTRIGSLQPIH